MPLSVYQPSTSLHQTAKLMVNAQSKPLHCHIAAAGDENKEIHQLHVKDIVLMQY